MKNKHFLNKNNKGLSLIEILVVITIFSILGMVISSSLILTIRGAKKSESIVKARENLNYTLAVMERNIRNARSVTNCGENDTEINYIDQYGGASSFSCQGDYIASGSAKLTSDAVLVTSCSISCIISLIGNPPVIEISLEVKENSQSGSQGSVVSADSTIYLRN
jgi:prepilin-type N-terminal cleavage/methylation domain-containing protein